MGLLPPKDPSQLITSFNEVPEPLRYDAMKAIDLMRAMPNQIRSSDEQNKWDVIMLKCQIAKAKIAYGIPGESQCFQCSQQFDSIMDRYAHEFENHTTESFRCANCPDRTFQDNSSLIRHLKKQHSIVPNPSEDILISYPIIEPNDGLLKCRLCPGAFTSELAFYYHNYESHKPKKDCLGCKICGKQATDIMDFKKHVLIIHGGYTHACPICEKRVGHFSKNTEENLTSKAREAFKMHLAQHCDGTEGSIFIGRKTVQKKVILVKLSLTIF